jgi:hypothetical protein
MADLPVGKQRGTQWMGGGVDLRERYLKEESVGNQTPVAQSVAQSLG